MKVGWVALITALGTLVWIFAAIGALAVVRAVADGSGVATFSPGSMLAEANADVSGADVSGLPRYPGSTRAEYRFAVWDDLAVTEVEYRTADDAQRVRAHYDDVFRDGGWTIETREYLRGEWSFRLSNGDRWAQLEIERLDDVTEVEIESTEPLRLRGPSTAR